MTLKEMHKRLGDIIAEHEARGWGDRNDQPVVVRVQNPKYKRRHEMYIGITRVASGTLSAHDVFDGAHMTEAIGTIYKF